MLATTFFELDGLDEENARTSLIQIGLDGWKLNKSMLSRTKPCPSTPVSLFSLLADVI